MMECRTTFEWKGSITVANVDDQSDLASTWVDQACQPLTHGRMAIHSCVDAPCVMALVTVVRLLRMVVVASMWRSNDGLKGDGVDCGKCDGLEDEAEAEVTDDVDGVQDATSNDPCVEFAVVVEAHAESDRQTLQRR